MTASVMDLPVSIVANTGFGRATVVFPADLTAWVEASELLQTVRTAAARTCGASWLNLVGDEVPSVPPDDLLVLTGYCYLQAIYHSIDIVRQLDQDAELSTLRGRLVIRPEEVRRFRRAHRRSLTDCLTHSLVALWKRRMPHAAADGLMPGQFLHNRIDFGFLEPFYLHAKDRLERAVVLDSMALDY